MPKERWVSCRAERELAEAFVQVANLHDRTPSEELRRLVRRRCEECGVTVERQQIQGQEAFDV